VARRWLDEGAMYLHVIDLDGAKGTGRANHEEAAAIHRLAAERGAQVQFGGGLRETKTVGGVLNGLGIPRAVIGTRAIVDPMWISLMLRLFPDRLILAIDAVDGKVVIKGWQETSGVDVVEFVRRANEWKVAGFLYTNVAVEGRLKGVDWVPVEAVLRASQRPVIVAGGISGLDDVKRCRDLGAYGIVLGTALYSGAIPLKGALDHA
jgi:phosphoribosylformimino-5-aminoimidazole carboxamide ribotide isomerase